MEDSELLDIIARGEDGKHQFKANFTNLTSLAAELVAFSNSGGGIILIGVADDGSFAGLTREDIRRLNNLLSNAASDLVRPPINPQCQNISTPSGLVMVVTVSEGISKPYMDNTGTIWIKSGSDKRRATSREEIQRMYQSAGLIHGDEIPAVGLTAADLDIDYFKSFFQKNYGEPVEVQEVSLPVLLENMNLMKDGVLNVTGALLFAKAPSIRLPVFIAKAVRYPGTAIDEKNYIDSQDITGRIADMFQKTLGFVLGNLGYIQDEQNVNAPGEPEIPRIVLEELIVNALIHRDYFISAPVRICIFRDRIEIISPGSLPNNLTVENIRRGISNIRNPVLASYATRILPYRGLGSGIVRSLKAYPDIQLLDDSDGNQFKAVIGRRLL